MIEHIIKYEFLQNAFLSGILIGIICPLIGVFLVVRRLSLISDTLAHVTFTGVAAGLLLQKYFIVFQSIHPMYIGISFSVAGAMIIEQFRRMFRAYEELALPIVLSSSVGLSVVLISLADGFNADVFGYLFGSLIAVSKASLLGIIVVFVLVISCIILFYKELFYLSFDEEGASLTGIPNKMLNSIFIILVALVIGVSMSIVGILLVSSLIALPVAASLQVARSFKQVFWFSIVFAQLSVLGGLMLSYIYDLASGGTIVVLSSTILVVVIVSKNVMIKVRNRMEINHG